MTAQIPVSGSRLKTAEFTYNEDGLRLSKAYDGTTTEYYYNGSVLIGMKIGTGSSAKVLRFSYDASGNAVAVDYSSNNGSSFTTYYYLRNAQNDVIKLIDGSGNTVVEYTYDSWGKIISSTGTLANTVGLYQPFRYRGYVYDTETQWYYLQSRYYDPATCRFISADVLLSTGQGVIGHNSFAYCGNNSAGRIDSEGTFWEEIGEFFQQLGEAFQNTMNALAPQQQWCTEIGMMDGPYPVADAIGLVGLAGIAIYAFGTAIYQTATAPAIPMPMTHSPAIAIPKVETDSNVDALPPLPPDTPIYRRGGPNPGNLTPRPQDISGLSFSLDPIPNSVMTTVGAVIATGKLVAVNDYGRHVSIVPSNASMQDWITAGRNSEWTRALQRIVKRTVW